MTYGNLKYNKELDQVEITDLKNFSVPVDMDPSDGESKSDIEQLKKDVSKLKDDVSELDKQLESNVFIEVDDGSGNPLK